MLLDCGATKTVAGEVWVSQLMTILSEEVKKKITRRPEKRKFRFGNGVLFPSQEQVSIPFELGNLKSILYISVVKAFPF